MIPRSTVRILGAGQTFIDIGCGRGRVLLMAAEHGFRKIIGIDFAADLCLTARGNVEQYRRCSNSSASISIEQRDACTYDIPNQPGVLFLYNRFNESVMRSFVANEERSLSQHPREFMSYTTCPYGTKFGTHPRSFRSLQGLTCGLQSGTRSIVQIDPAEPCGNVDFHRMRQ